MKRSNCFGSAGVDIGQSRVPDPPAIILAYRIKSFRLNRRAVQFILGVAADAVPAEISLTGESLQPVFKCGRPLA